MTNENCNGIIMYKRTTHLYIPHMDLFCGLKEKRKFYDTCLKNIKKINNSVWSDKSRTSSELIEIVEDLE